MREMNRQASHEVERSRPATGLSATAATMPALRPVVLRAAAAAVEEPPPALDTALLLAERLLIVILAVVITYSVVDGPVRDWLHDEAPVAQAGTVPRVVAPKAPRFAAKVHPELGAALPSSNQAPRAQPVRPAPAPADYLRPAQRPLPAAERVEEPAPAPPQPAAAVDFRPVHLLAPRAGIDTRVEEVFLQSGVWQVADYAAGYLHGTGVPGDGNIVMAGHKGIRGAVFANLEQLKPGDEVFVDAAGQRFRYRVRATGSVWPAQVSIMYPTPNPTLTLLTCTNWDLQRFVVIADLVDSAKLAAQAGG